MQRLLSIAALIFILALSSAGFASDDYAWDEWQEIDFVEQYSAQQLNELDQVDWSDFEDSNWQVEDSSLQSLSELEQWDFDEWSESFDNQYYYDVDTDESIYEEYLIDENCFLGEGELLEEACLYTEDCLSEERCFLDDESALEEPSTIILIISPAFTEPKFVYDNPI